MRGRTWGIGAVIAMLLALGAGPARAGWVFPPLEIAPDGFEVVQSAAPDGTVTFALPRFDFSLEAVRINPAGSLVLPRVPVASYPPLPIREKVVTAPSGVATVLWIAESSVGQGGPVLARRVRPDGTVVPPASDPALVVQSTKTSSLQAAVAPSGTVAAVWGDSSIEARLIRPAGELVPPAANPPLALGTGAEPELATAPDGTATVVFFDPGAGGVHARRIRPDGSLFPAAGQAPLTVSPVGTGAHVAVARDGTATVVWTAASTTFARRIRPNGAMDPLPTIVAPNAGAAGVGVGQSGVATVLLFSFNGQMQARHLRPDGSLGPVHTLSPPDQGGDPRLVVDPTGIATAVWTAFGSTPLDVLARRLHPDETLEPAAGQPPVKLGAGAIGLGLASDPFGTVTASWPTHTFQGPLRAVQYVVPPVCAGGHRALNRNSSARIPLPCFGLLPRRAIRSGPRHGRLSGDAASGSVTYTPARNYSGPDSFTFGASNRGGASPTATVTLDVRTPPETGRPRITVLTNVRGCPPSSTFTIRVHISDRSSLREATVTIDGVLVRRTTRKDFTVRRRGLGRGRHSIVVRATDRYGNSSSAKRSVFCR